MEFKLHPTRPYLIAEIGINHNGDIQIAKKLIDSANSISWDCIKFQKRNPDICVPEKQKSTMRDTPWGKMTYIEYRHRIEFGKKEYDYIDEYCKEKPISWTASVWDIDSLNFMKNYNVPFFKIPSAKINDLELLEAVIGCKKPVVISAGMSTLEEIDRAVDMLKHKKTEYILMHTNSSYPAAMNELNLNCIKTLKKKYNCEIGYSGHEYSLDPTVYAVVLGARVIERHITLDHSMWGTDQAASIEPMGMDILRKRIKDVNEILGDGVKVITEDEKKIRE